MVYLYRLSHCGLVTPYGDMELGQHWLRLWRVAWRHQAITWTNIDLSSVRSLGIHLRASLLDNMKIPINKTRLKIAVLKWHPGLPRASELHQPLLVKLLCISSSTAAILCEDVPAEETLPGASQLPQEERGCRGQTPGFHEIQLGQAWLQDTQ